MSIARKTLWSVPLVLLIVIFMGSGRISAFISGADILNGTVTGADILNGSISGADLMNNSVKSIDIYDETLTHADIKNNSIISADIRDATIQSVDIKDNSIFGIDVRDGTIGLVDLNVEIHDLFDEYDMAVTTSEANAVLLDEHDSAISMLRTDVDDLAVRADAVDAELASLDSRVSTLELGHTSHIWVHNGHDEILGILLDEETYGGLTAVKYYDTYTDSVHEMPKYGDDVHDILVSFLGTDCSGMAVILNPDTRVYPYDTESFFVRAGENYWIYDLNDTTEDSGSTASYMSTDGECANASITGPYLTLKEVSEGFVDGSAYPLYYHFDGPSME